MLKRFGFRSTFRAVFEEYAELDGVSFTMIRHMPPDKEDEESYGMFEIEIQGKVITAHPEEVIETLDGEPFLVYVAGLAIY